MPDTSKDRHLTGNGASEKGWANRFLNLILRGFALGSRFALYLILARYLPVEEVGTYALFLTAITVSVGVLGLEFYTYSIRRLLKSEVSDASFVLQHHGLIALVALGVAGIIFYSVASLCSVPAVILDWFFPILVIEYVGQELYRYLVALNRQITASLVLALKQGVWVWIVLLLFIINPENRSLTLVLPFWLTGGIIALGYGGVNIYQAIGSWKLWSFDYSWVKRGLKVSMIYFAAAVSLRLMLGLDKYLVAWFSTQHDVGIYAVNAAVAVLIVNVLEAVVVPYAYPKLVAGVGEGASSLYRSGVRELVIGTITVAIGISIVLGTLSPTAITMFSEAEYSNASLLWILIGANIAYALSTPAHYILYAHGRDDEIAKAQVAGLVVFGGVGLVSCLANPLIGAAIGLFSGHLIGLVTKCIYALKTNGTARPPSHVKQRIA